MGTKRIAVWGAGLIVCAVAGALCLPGIVRAHCDTMDGPVVTDARLALEKADVTPVLKWVQPKDEREIRDAFKKTLAVRAKGAEARELADRYFFETLVRVHRAGEGAEFTGLKPAGTELDPAVEAGDKALESGSADKVVEMVTNAVADGVRARFEKAFEARKKAEASVEAGREAVEAYVEFVHYVERLHADASSAASHHGDNGEEAAAPMAKCRSHEATKAE